MVSAVGESRGPILLRVNTEGKMELLQTSNYQFINQTYYYMHPIHGEIKH